MISVAFWVVVISVNSLFICSSATCSHLSTAASHSVFIWGEAELNSTPVVLPNRSNSLAISWEWGCDFGRSSTHCGFPFVQMIGSFGGRRNLSGSITSSYPVDKRPTLPKYRSISRQKRALVNLSLVVHTEARGIQLKFSVSAGTCRTFDWRSLYFVRGTWLWILCCSWVGKPLEFPGGVPVGCFLTGLVPLTFMGRTRLPVWFPSLFVDPRLWLRCVKVFPWVSRSPAIHAITVASRSSLVR